MSSEVDVEMCPPGWSLTALTGYVTHKSGDSKIIKGKQSSAPASGLVQGYSASGPDVWVKQAHYHGPGIVVSAVGARCGKTFLADGQWTAIANTHAIIPKHGLDPKFFWYVTNREEWWVKSGTAQPFVKVKDTLERPFAMPPIEEQREIVRILEEQFSRLDAAAASIAAVRRKADQFRHSLLRAAFTGCLTQHGARRVTVELSANSVVLPSGWTSRQLGDCGDWIGGGTPSKSNEKFWTNGTIPWLSPKDMGPTVISETQDKITPDALQGSATALVASNSVAVVVRSGILERRLPAALVPFETTLNQDMKALEVRGDILPKWVLYALHAFNHEILAECRKAGTTVASIEFPRLRMYEIPVAPPDEQQEVVRLLEEQFSRQEAILTVADAADRKVAALRRSLLHAAFSGELTKEWREKNNG